MKRVGCGTLLFSPSSALSCSTPHPTTRVTETRAISVTGEAHIASPRTRFPQGSFPSTPNAR